MRFFAFITLGFELFSSILWLFDYFIISRTGARKRFYYIDEKLNSRYSGAALMRVSTACRAILPARKMAQEIITLTLMGSGNGFLLPSLSIHMPQPHLITNIDDIRNRVYALE